jgi:phage terminase small subunit
MLNPKQAAFAAEYLVDLNATQAALRAGYSARTAKAQGSRLLTVVDVQAAIQAEQKIRAKRVETTTDRIVTELAHIAFFDPADLVAVGVTCPEDIAKLPEHVRRAIVGWGWDRFGNFTLKFAPKTTALDLLGRHNGMFKDRVEVTGKDGAPLVQIYLPTNSRDVPVIEGDPPS